MLRIEFSEGKDIKMLKLLEKFFTEDEFSTVPKLIICQFCRGTTMVATETDGTNNSDLPRKVNGQEIVMEIFNPKFNPKKLIVTKRNYPNKNKTDMAILYATASGNHAPRSRSSGSPFITKLCEQLQKREKRTIYQERT